MPASPTSASETSREKYIDPATLMRIKNLQIRAKAVVEGFFSGLHRSPFHGFSAEFSEYRQYSPGDDPRYLDWKLYARSDRFYIKRFEDETNLRCYLLADMSQSMAFGSIEYSKAEYARTMAATLAYFLNTQRDAVGLVTFHETVDQFIPARHRSGHFARLLVALEQSLSGTQTDITAPLDHLAGLVPKRGLVVLISDMLAPVDSLQEGLGLLRSQGHEVLVFRVLDPAELTFNFDKPSMFYDLESGKNLYIDPEVARNDYVSRFEEHAEQIKQTCDDLGVDFVPLSTERPLELAMFDYLNARSRRGRSIMRRGAK